MYTLLLDTSTKTLYTALVKDDEVLNELYIVGKNDHAKNLFIAIDKVLKSENIKITELDGIVCGVGPGSYTGVRMAVTVGKMLASNSKVRLYSVSSLYLMSSGYSGRVLPLIDARRGNSFCACYDGYNVIDLDMYRNTEEFIRAHKDAKVVKSSQVPI